ncbi:MAG TPA: C25 family cysteine peptidase, partial [Bacteroidota bacterium]|nr:C25 family cysteine peptidase [Bacteroidota bacterium]
MNKYFHIAFFLMIGVSVSVAGVKTSAQRKSFTIVESSADQVVVDIQPQVYRDHFITVEGKQMRQFAGSLNGMTSDTGKPELPIEGFLIAIPPGRMPVLDILESKFSLETTTQVAPAPSYTFNANHEAVAHYRTSKSFYATQTQLYPQNTVELGQVARVRDLSAVKVLVYPLQYNPALAQLKRLTHLKVRIRFQPDTRKSSQAIQAAWRPVTTPDPQFDPVYKNLILNADAAQTWRGIDSRELLAAQTDSTASWFQTGRQYYRIPVIIDGLYHLNYSDLLAYGIDLTQLNNSTAALYYKGHSLPLRVQTTDSSSSKWFIEFYAHRNYGTNSYYDRYNDTSSYWLTWGDANPIQSTNVGLTPPPPTDTAKYFMQTMWRETDESYFFGVTDDEVQTTDDVPGEGWYWTPFYSGQSKNLSFAIDTIARKTGTLVQIKARFYGMTICTGGGCIAPSRHEASVSVNSFYVGTIDWTDNTEAIFTGTMPDSMLKKGGNLFTVASKAWDPSAMNITEFYIDWFQVTYPHPYLTSGGNLTCTLAPSSNQYRSFVVNGMSKDSATVFDTDNGRLLTNLIKITSTSFVVSDTATVLHHYSITAASGKKKPSILIGKTFANLRNPSLAADYVVITHSLFKTDATRLAQFRQTHNKLRTAVIDVQDIYDEFNYGHLDPTSLRSFLKYAYYNWTKPSPTYVLFFGGTTWDPKKNLPTSIKVNYVPSYGNPPSDNALVCFDTTLTYMPYMLTGRIPAETTATATAVVNKIIAYETPPQTAWDKQFLFITGGADAGEQYSFQLWSNQLSNSYVAPPPIGGTSIKVYKNTNAIIDGENKAYLQQLFQGGLVFVNFIGHSGGRIWDVDIGSPYDLQNTGGDLPFVSSVSCNVGFFSDPEGPVLSEDFLDADNRGAIAVWAASSIGYGSVGQIMDQKFLSLATRDYARNLGIMTTLSRLQFWLANNKIAAPLVVQTLHLHPLIGDPATNLALPVYPDFDIASSDISLLNNPPTSDSTVTAKIYVRNLGILAGSPIMVSVHDTYTDEQGHTTAERNVVPPFYIPDFVQQDSFYVNWNVQRQPGGHTLTVRIDPLDSIPEAQKTNNTAASTFYIYRNSIAVIKPVSNSLVLSQTPSLVVTTPATSDTTSLTYTFQIDTVSTFSSPALVTSPAIIPSGVSASWQPPALLGAQTYYWRAQTSDGQRQGAWTNSSFRVSASAPHTIDTTSWQLAGRQLGVDNVSMGTLSDSGISMLKTDSTTIYVRSLGLLENPDKDYYSLITVGNVTASGLWWQDPYSYLAGWFNPVNGTYQLNGYNLLNIGEVDSMTAFLAAIPNGYYVMISAVIDPIDGATDALYQQIQLLGSTQIRLVQYGQSWMLISQKGVRLPIMETYQPNAVADGTVIVGNVYHSGATQIVSPVIGPATQWQNASTNFS